jgi:hypothetical protein
LRQVIDPYQGRPSNSLGNVVIDHGRYPFMQGTP